jgi:hypothetical protein
MHDKLKQLRRGHTESEWKRIYNTINRNEIRSHESSRVRVKLQKSFDFQLENQYCLVLKVSCTRQYWFWEAFSLWIWQDRISMYQLQEFYVMLTDRICGSRESWEFWSTKKRRFIHSAFVIFFADMLKPMSEVMCAGRQQRAKNSSSKPTRVRRNLVSVTKWNRSKFSLWGYVDKIFSDTDLKDGFGAPIVVTECIPVSNWGSICSLPCLCPSPLPLSVQ